MTLAGKTLAGRRILVTRPRRPGEAREPLAAMLRGLGAEVLWLPALEIGPPDDWSPLDRAIDRLSGFDWLVFTSRNGVEGFASRLSERPGERGLTWNGSPKVAAVGRKTAEALKRLGRAEVHIPPEPLASALAASLAGECEGRRFLWPRAQVAPVLLAQQLLQAGAAEVVTAACYAARPARADAGPVRTVLADGRIDAVVFTSARAVEATLQALGNSATQWLSLIVRICIGPVTAQACRAFGLGAPIVADGSLEGLVRVLIETLGG